MGWLPWIGLATFAIVGLAASVAIVALSLRWFAYNVLEIRLIATSIFIWNKVRSAKTREEQEVVKHKLWDSWSKWVDDNTPTPPKDQSDTPA